MNLNQQKTLFKTYYCSACNQTKPCHLLDQAKCCACYFQAEQEEAREYSDYQQIFQRKLKESKEKFQQLERLRSYKGCKVCGSLEVDAYFLYENSRLVCQPCLMKKEGSTSGAISFSTKQKWYKKRWGIDLVE